MPPVPESISDESSSRAPGLNAIDVSVVLTRDGDREQTARCAAAILSSSVRVDYELLLADDVPQPPAELLHQPESSRVRYIPLAAVSNVPNAWNEVAASARGRYLVFVSPCIQPIPGWLDDIAGCANLHPELAAVGLHVVGADESARPMAAGLASPECPAQAFADLEARNATQLDRSTLPAIGEGCLLIRAKDFAEVGGVDTRLGARGAMLDLCLKLLARGKRIGFTRACVLVSRASPASPAEDARHAAALRRRWGVARSTSPNALWVDGRKPRGGASGPGAAGHFPADKALSVPPFVDVGHRTYFGGGARFLTWTAEERIRIGKYCSFAANITISTGGGHSTDMVSTYPFEVQFFGVTQPTRSFRSTRDTVVGNDVWVGDGAVIGGGVCVGDGAVISAQAVVLEDIPPYAVVVGNPARVVRYRFSQPAVEALLRIAWWDWPEAKVRAELEWFFRPVSEFVARFDVGGTANGEAAGAP
jgi:acetyltransferase-like isoleucine patch superfamily enzyme/GT2 family glycosyltransferase